MTCLCKRRCLPFSFPWSPTNSNSLRSGHNTLMCKAQLLRHHYRYRQRQWHRAQTTRSTCLDTSITPDLPRALGTQASLPSGQCLITRHPRSTGTARRTEQWAATPAILHRHPTRLKPLRHTPTPLETTIRHRVHGPQQLESLPRLLRTAAVRRGRMASLSNTRAEALRQPPSRSMLPLLQPLGHTAAPTGDHLMA